MKIHPIHPTRQIIEIVSLNAKHPHSYPIKIYL